ncbi:MAG: Ferredoxin-like protein involved in electron transfer, partial [uncultured Corynebacteriales bacterium]
ERAPVAVLLPVLRRRGDPAVRRGARRVAVRVLPAGVRAAGGAGGAGGGPRDRPGASGGDPV